MFGETLIFDVIIVSHPTETTTFKWMLQILGMSVLWHKDARLSPLTPQKKHDFYDIKHTGNMLKPREPRKKKKTYFPVYWLFSKDPYNVYFWSQQSRVE